MLFSSFANRDNAPLQIPFWILALCCALPVLGVLSTASGMGWPTYLEGTDIRPYLTGGAIVRNGEGVRLYDLETQWRWQQALFPGLRDNNSSDLLPFLAPPFVAAPMALLAALPTRTAFLIWLGCNWLFLSLLTHQFVSALHGFGRRAQIITVVLCVTCAPVFITLLQGQWALVLTIALLLSWLHLRRGCDWRGGLWLSALLFKPQLLLLLVLVLLYGRRWRALAGFACGVAALSILSLLLVGVEGLGSYASLLQTASNWNHQYGVRPEAMYTWRGLLHNFTPQPGVLWWLGVVPLLGTLAWCWHRAHPFQSATSHLSATSSTRTNELGLVSPRSVAPRSVAPRSVAQFDALWAMTIFAALFCSPYLYYHDLTLLLVPVLLMPLAIQLQDEGDGNKQLKRLRTALLALPVFGFVLFWIEFFFISSPLGTVAPNVLYMVLCFSVLALWVFRLQPRNSSRIKEMN